MSETVVEEVLIRAINELEKSGDIIVLNTVENAIAKKLLEAIMAVSPNMLTARELGGIINALNAHSLGFGLDDNDFQTVIGLTKQELKAASSKLKLKDW